MSVNIIKAGFSKFQAIIVAMVTTGMFRDQCPSDRAAVDLIQGITLINDKILTLLILERI